MERNRKIDFLKGVLILFVVVAHYNAGFAHDIIFLFHMPLFFILSGILLQKEKVTDISYIRHRAVAMLVPYICYLLLDLLIIRRDFTLSGIAHLLWGGRAISGTYWYVTCFIATLMIFSFVLKYFNAKIIGLIIAGGGYCNTRIPFIGTYTFSEITGHSVEC